MYFYMAHETIFRSKNDGYEFIKGFGDLLNEWTEVFCSSISLSAATAAPNTMTQSGYPAPKVDEDGRNVYLMQGLLNLI